MKKLNFTVDSSKCIRCDACVADCPRHIICRTETENDGLPAIPPLQEQNCLECQHCLAVCPTGAVSILGRHPQNSIELTPAKLPAAEQMHTLLRARRSVRQYKNENVPSNLIDTLLATLANSPTGCNDRLLRFLVVSDLDMMQRLRLKVIESLEEQMRRHAAMPDFLSAAVTAYRQQGVDELFRGAPHLLVVSEAESASCPKEDVDLALAYFELLAQSAGLGTTWCGYLKFAVDAAPQLRQCLGLGPQTPFYAMLFGHPNVRYARTVQRDNAAKIEYFTLNPTITADN